ncbi:hypothetical protein JCM31271_23330 [Halorubrum trueperi]
MDAGGSVEIRRLPTDDDLHRYAAELWLPYHRDLAAAETREQDCVELRLDVDTDE